MADNRKSLTSGDDSNSYGKSVLIGLGLGALCFASRGWLSERGFFWAVITVALFYCVIAPFRSYWAKPRFWCALSILFGGHAALLRYVDGHVLQWSFWEVMKLGAPEGLAMILILGWVLGDNYFMRDTRREREREATQEDAGERAQRQKQSRGYGRPGSAEFGR